VFFVLFYIYVCEGVEALWQKKNLMAPSQSCSAICHGHHNQPMLVDGEAFAMNFTLSEVNW
jgi:hypothetical protein